MGTRRPYINAVVPESPVLVAMLIPVQCLAKPVADAKKFFANDPTVLAIR